MPPRHVDSGRDQIDPFVKPKPGQKPKPVKPIYAGPSAVQARQQGVTQQAQANRTVVPTPEEQKRILCRYYEQGLCERGSACWFAHGKEELRHPQKYATRQQIQKQPSIGSDIQEQCPDEAVFKTKMCVYFQQGRCQRGPTCTFAHDPAELQSFDRARRFTPQQAQAANARPLTLDQYLPNQLKQETSSTTGSPERFSAQNSTAALPAAPTAPTRGSAQSLRPKIAVPTSRVAPPNSSFARPNENSSARISNAAASSHAAVIGVCAPSSKPYSEVENKVEASTKGVLSIEKSLGDLSFLGEGDDDLEAPQSFCCPITTELLVDPVVAADGHTYERHDITEWLMKNDTSPMTNERMEHKHLIPNLALRAVMDAYFGIRS